MKVIIEYAVRVKGTQCYMVRSQRRDGRGGSHLEPMDMTDPSSWPSRYTKGMMIRTFADRNAAMNLLRSWVRGKVYGDWDGYQSTTKIPERNINDFEVVEIELHLPK